MTFYCLTANYFFWGSIEGTAKVAGATVHLCKTGAECAAALTGGAPATLFVDLQHPDALSTLTACQHYPTRTIGFVSHMDTDRIAAARAAGCQTIMPKSQFFARLPLLLKDAAA